MKAAIYFAFFANLAVVIVIFAVKRFMPPVVPLFYGLPYGQSQLTEYSGLLIVPAACFAISVLNIVIALKLNDLFYKKALVVSSAVITLLGAITVGKIIALVGFF